MRYTEEIFNKNDLPNQYLEKKLAMKEATEVVLLTHSLLPGTLFRDSKTVLQNLLIIICKDAIESVRVWQASALGLLDRLFLQFNSSSKIFMSQITNTSEGNLLQQLINMVSTKLVSKTFEIMSTNPNSMLSTYESAMSCLTSIAMTQYGGKALMDSNFVSVLLSSHVTSVSSLMSDQQDMDYIRRYHQILIPMLKLIVSLYASNYEQFLANLEHAKNLLEVIVAFRRIFTELLQGKLQIWQQDMEDFDSNFGKEIQSFVLEELVLISDLFCLISRASMMNDSISKSSEWNRIKRLEPFFLAQLIQYKSALSQEWYPATPTNIEANIKKRLICRNVIVYCRNRMYQSQRQIEVLVLLPNFINTDSENRMEDVNTAPGKLTLENLYDCLGILIDELGIELQEWKHTQPQALDSLDFDQFMQETAPRQTNESVKQCREAILTLHFMIENLILVIDKQLGMISSIMESTRGVLSSLLEGMNAVQKMKEETWNTIKNKLDQLREWCKSEDILKDNSANLFIVMDMLQKTCKVSR